MELNILNAARINISKSNIVSNFIWKFAERIGNQLVSLIVTIVLARLLSPSEYGLIAMGAVFITIANEFVATSFTNALIQKKDADNIDFSSVLFLNIGISIIMYGIIFITAPMIADFYDYEILTPVMRVLGLNLIIAAINSVQQAYISRNMIFKKFFYSTLGATLSSAIVGISMAYMGFGVWALVVQNILSGIVATCIIWFTVDWRPQRIFSINRVKGLFTFGWKLLGAGLLNTLSNQSNQLIIGKMYASSDLAYYNKGLLFPSMIMININASINSVMFPVIVMAQDDCERLKMLTRKFVRVSSYFIFPMMTGLAAIADPLISLLLTDKWLYCIPYLRIGCFIYSATIIQIAVQNAIMALGRSDVFLKMDIIRKILGISILIAVMNHGVMAIALFSIITASFSIVMVAIVSKHMIGYGYREHIYDNIPILIVSVIMGFLVYMFKFLELPNIITLLIQLPVGFITYMTLSLWFKFDGFILAVEYLKKLICIFPVYSIRSCGAKKS